MCTFCQTAKQKKSLKISIFARTNCNKCNNIAKTDLYSIERKMKRILTFVTMMVCLQAMAADKIVVTGSIVDRQEKIAIAFADVAAYTVKDSTKTLADASLTDDRGEFELKLTPGDYTLSIEYLGYKKRDKKITVTSAKDTMNIGSLGLKQNVEMLETAVIQADAIAVQTKNDTVEYNASSFKVAEGSAVEDLLKKLPGAEVSNDGKLTVNGKEIKKILVNGKEFFSDDPSVAMKSLPSNMVKNVKTYSKKSDEARLTGIDDGEEEAVLDLTVKKEMMQGWSGNVQAGLGGSPFHHDLGVTANRISEDQNLTLIANSNDINSRGFSERGGGPSASAGNGRGITESTSAGVNYVKNAEKIKYGGNARYGYTENESKKISEEEMFLKEGVSNYSNDTSKSVRKRHDVSVDFQLEWTPDSTSTLIFRPNFSYGKTDIDSDSRNRTMNNDHHNTNSSKSLGHTTGDNMNVGGMLRYVKKLNSKGRNISLNAKADYSFSDSDVDNISNTIFYDKENDEIESEVMSMNRYTDKENHGMTYRLGAAYTEPISKHHSAQIRYTYQQRNTDSKSLTYEKEGNQTNRYLDSLSNQLDNEYDTHELELNVQGLYTKLKYKIGFNASPQTTENNISAGPNKGHDTKQTVWNFAPNLMLRYNISQKNRLMFRYRGSTSAPDVSYLQEVIDQSNPLNIKYGNPDLKPSYTNNMSLRYNNYISKNQSNIAANLSFQNVVNAITDKVIYDEENGTRETYKDNIGGNWNTSAFVSYMTPIGKTKFRISSSTQGRYSQNVGYANTRDQYAQKSKTKNTSLNERLTGTYQQDNFDISLNGSLGYVNAKNNLNSSTNRRTYDWTIGATGNVNLPWNMQLGTDINWNIYDGYSDDFKDNELIWNAQLQKSFLKQNAASIKVKAIDILQQQNNLTRTHTAHGICDATYNSLGTYVMVYFTYKFNTIGKNGGGNEADEYGDKPNFEQGGRPNFGERPEGERRNRPEGERRNRPEGGRGGFGGPMY